MVPLVTVVIATYRRDKELVRALKSVLNQAYLNIEVIVVDDNDDGLWNQKIKEIINFAKTNTTISITYLCNHPNLGSAKARNVGINNANGDYICFLDDDDVYLPARIQNQVSIMEQENSVYSLTDLKLYNEDDTICQVRKRDYLFTNEGKNLLLCHLKYHMTGTDTMMFRKKYLLDIGSFDPIDVGDEYYLMMKAVKKGGKFSYVPVCDVIAYVHTGNGGLSSGQCKVDGENVLFEYKRQFFNDISKKDVNYIVMRHYAVLAFAGIRMKNYWFAMKNAVMSISTAPASCVKLLIRRKG